jgi:NIMA (never in mitosis gene a)-related kinase
VNLGEIGKGTYGKVFVVKRKSDKKMFVLKKVPKENVVKDEDFAKKYKNHKFAHIVKIYEWFYEEDMFCLIMELCPNGSLSDFIYFCEKTNRYIEESVFF